MSGKDLVVQGGKAPALSGSKVAPSIRTGITDLLVAFATGSQRDIDKPALLRLYTEAAAGFPEPVVTSALAWLKLHNPRNPFHPTPQDLFETCDAIRETWRERIVAYFTDAGAPWR